MGQDSWLAAGTPAPRHTLVAYHSRHKGISWPALDLPAEKHVHKLQGFEIGH